MLQQPFPDLARLVAGLAFVVFGLTFFVFGLEQGLFPIGESLAYDFARKGSAVWLFTFAFALGFGTTVAREIPFSFIQFPIYEGLKRAIALMQGTETTATQVRAKTYPPFVHLLLS